MLLIIDNYDSFTYNLVQYFAELGVSVEVYRNNELTVEEIEAKRPKQLSSHQVRELLITPESR